MNAPRNARFNINHFGSAVTITLRPGQIIHYASQEGEATLEMIFEHDGENVIYWNRVSMVCPADGPWSQEFDAVCPIDALQAVSEEDDSIQYPAWNSHRYDTVYANAMA